MVETHNPVPAQRPVTEEASILPIWDLDRLLCHHRSLQRPPSYLNGLKLSGLWWEQLLNNISPKKNNKQNVNHNQNMSKHQALCLCREIVLRLAHLGKAENHPPGGESCKLRSLK